MQKVRFNALRHGLRAKTLVLPDENQAEFDALLQDLESEFQPQTPVEFIQVERMAVNYWKLARADRREAFYRLNDMPDRFVDQSFKCQQGFERTFDRALQSLERLQKNRCAVAVEDSPVPEPVEASPQPQPVEQEAVLRGDCQSARPGSQPCASAAPEAFGPASEPVEQIPQPPAETVEAAASCPVPGPRPIPAHEARYLRQQSAEMEKRERALMKAGFLRSADYKDYPKNPIIPPQF